MDIAYQIPRQSLIWVLLSVVMALAPHAPRLPVWIGAVVAACLAWRVLIFFGKLDYPGKALRVVLVVFIILSSATQISSLDIGLDVAASLLALGFIFKLVEMQSKRDTYVVLCLCFVMALVSLLYSQSMVTAMYLTLMVIVIMGSMVSLNRTAGSGRRTTSLGLAVRITAQSLPLMIVLFLVFPRIDPLWAVPTQSSATTGVSEEMSPGDISRLAQSADLAFRVGFNSGPPPLHENLYWRGLVLDNFDGITWRRQGSSVLSTAVANAPVQLDYRERTSVSGSALDYNVILEPTQQRWLYGLHLATPLTAGIVQGRNFELINRSVVNQRLSYNLRSFRNNQTDLLLLDSIRRRSLRLPEGGNPRSRELAMDLRSDVETDRDYAYAVLALFQQQFRYTLSPPLLGEQRVDDFLFNTRAGFCEHYASAFTYMMRAGGVPARVVVGYQGGEYNRFEDYLMVYQYNAHAWTEVWLAGEGWVRFDPTAIVSPERISQGVEAALRNDPSFMNESRFSLARFRGSGVLNTLRLRLDAMEYAWNRRIVSYGEERQLEIFERWFGQAARSGMLLVLGVSTLLAATLIGFVIIRKVPGKKMAEHDRLYRECCQYLARRGYPRENGEGPMNYCHRITALHPELTPLLAEVTQNYILLSYEATPDAVEKSHLQALKRAVKELRSRVSAVPVRDSVPQPG